VTGCPERSASHAVQATRACLLFLKEMPALRQLAMENKMKIRVGLHTGPCIAGDRLRFVSCFFTLFICYLWLHEGVIGIQNPRYHIFGDTVLIANQMEATAAAGTVHVSDATHSALLGQREFWRDGREFEFSDCGEEDIKGCGTLRSWVVEDGGSSVK
jgi:atrial natriuretic peptide receptor A